MMESVQVGAVTFVCADDVTPRVGGGGRCAVTLCVAEVGTFDTPAVRALELCGLTLPT